MVLMAKYFTSAADELRMNFNNVYEKKQRLTTDFRELTKDVEAGNNCQSENAEEKCNGDVERHFDIRENPWFQRLQQLIAFGGHVCSSD